MFKKKPSRRSPPAPPSDLTARVHLALQLYVNPECHGVEVWLDPYGHRRKPVHCLTRDTYLTHRRYLDWIADGRQGTPPTYPDGTRYETRHYYRNLWDVRAVEESQQGEQKYYTSGVYGHALLYIDLDAHEPWQTDRAALHEEVVGFLGLQNLFVCQDSRIYMLVNYRGTPIKEANEVLFAFTAALNRWAKAKGFLSDVDAAKGTIRRHETDEETGERRVTYGVLARLPKMTYACLERFRSATRWTPDMIRTATEYLVQDTDQDAADETIARCEELRTGIPREQAAAVNKGKKSKRARATGAMASGSVTGFPMSAAELEAVPTILRQYRDLSYRCQYYSARLEGRKILAADFAIALVVLSICAHHPNADGSMPWARAKKLWSWLYDHGHVERGFSSERWKVIRETLADLGICDVVDEEYHYFEDEDGEDGKKKKKKKGKAAKWHLRQEFVADFAQGEETGEKRERILAHSPEYAPLESIAWGEETGEKRERDLSTQSSPAQETAVQTTSAGEEKKREEREGLSTHLPEPVYRRWRLVKIRIYEYDDKPPTEDAELQVAMQEAGWEEEGGPSSSLPSPRQGISFWP